MLLLSWNVAGRVTRLAEQVEIVLATAADVVCLQEVTPTTLERWRAALAGAGHAVAASLDAFGGRAPARDRRLGVLTAARAGLELAAAPAVPWPERLLCTRLGDPPGALVCNFHSPTSAREDLVKVRSHELLHAHLAAERGPRILCGDLNTPQYESRDGERVWTFARDERGRMIPERGERWERAELALIRGLEGHGMRDAFRAVHGPEPREWSWTYPRRRRGFRLDHVICSDDFDVLGCAYEHGWRTGGLSDHSAVLAHLRARG